MDPNETLKQIEEIINHPDMANLYELIDLIDTLNKWICNGGMLPKKWEEGLLDQHVPGIKLSNMIDSLYRFEPRKTR